MPILWTFQILNQKLSTSLKFGRLASIVLRGSWSRLFYRPNAITFRIHKIFLLIAQTYKSFSTIKKLLFYYRLLISTRNNIALYKSEYCKHKTSLVRTRIYFREQYYAFGNQLGALVQKSFVFENFM